VSEVTESYIEILNLIYTYPDRIDSGDFAGIGELFADAVIEMGDGLQLEGSAEIEQYYVQWTRRYPDDRTPHTRHCITNPIVRIDEAAGSAVARYYITVFQRTEAFPLQPVWSNKYEDSFRRVNGAWRFVHRRGYDHLPGDISQHLLQEPGQLA
jgi:hypothetical protein